MSIPYNGDMRADGERMAALRAPRSEPFEAAVDAGFSRCDDYPCGGVPCSCEQNRERTRRIIAAALPPDPAPETLFAMAVEMMKDDPLVLGCLTQDEAMETAAAAYRAFRASLLPGEEPS